MIDLGHLGVVLQEIDDLQRILYMTLYAQAQRLDTLQQDKGIEGRQCGTSITQQDGTDASHVSGGTDSISKHDAMIGGIGFG